MTTDSTRSLDCPKCGAPLDWTGDVHVIECEYCESHIQVADRRLTQAAAQQRVRTAPRPAAPPAPAAAPSPRRRGKQLWWSQASRRQKALAAGGAALALAAVVVLVLWAQGDLGAKSPSEELLRRLETEASQQEVIDLLGKPAGNEAYRVTVDFRAGIVRRAEVYWEPPDTRSVIAVNLFPAGGFDVDAVLARLRPLAPNRLRPINDKSWEIRVGPGELSISPFAISVRSHRRDDPQWKPRFAAFWAAARFAALGGAEPTDEQRRLLNGPRLAETARLDTTLTVENAGDGFRQSFPGSSCRQQAGLLCVVDVDDPRVQEVRWGWPNAVNGRLREVALVFPRRDDAARAQRELATCLKTVLGGGTEEVSDHIRGTRSFTWPIGADGDVAVLQEGFLGLAGAAGAPPERPAAWPARYAAVVEAVAGCRP